MANFLPSQARDQKQIYRLNETMSHLGLNPPLSQMRHLKNWPFVSNLFPCERGIKIKVVSEEKITKSFFLVNKNQYSIKRDYNSETCLEELKSLP